MHLIAADKGMLGSAPLWRERSRWLSGGPGIRYPAGRQGNRILLRGRCHGRGVLYESLNFAALKKLPLIFACENNFYATHMPIRECRVSGDIAKVATPFGIEAHVVDGNDVLQMYDVGRKAVERCRRGEGPVFLNV
jgi:pyruvate dehydrogenase E1 component alpha subunit